jgi:hypothetical protein
MANTRSPSPNVNAWARSATQETTAAKANAVANTIRLNAVCFISSSYETLVLTDLPPVDHLISLLTASRSLPPPPLRFDQEWSANHLESRFCSLFSVLQRHQVPIRKQ